MREALLIVDMQNDFMLGGPLGIEEADAIVPLINKLASVFPLVIATKDWHPKVHLSFAENHSGKKVGDIIKIEGIEQILWPTHCVQHSQGAELVSSLNQKWIHHTIFKGVDAKIDSYSAFYDNAHLRKTGLEDLLRNELITDLTVVGVATDYCVLYSVMDALSSGYRVTVIADGCKGINLKRNDEKKALNLMKKEGAKIL